MQAKVSDTIKRAINDGGDNFTGLLIKLYAKADGGNKARLRKGFPVECAAYDSWFNNPEPVVPEFVEVSEDTVVPI